MSNSIIPKVLIAFTQTLISFNIAVNISCLNYYFCNGLWQKNLINYDGSSCKENSPPLKGEPVPIETHTGDFGPCHFLHQRSLTQTQVAKPELKPEPEITPEPKPTRHVSQQNHLCQWDCWWSMRGCLGALPPQQAAKDETLTDCESECFLYVSVPGTTLLCFCPALNLLHLRWFHPALIHLCS